MKDWLKVDNSRKSQVYEQVAASQGLPPFAIEKDFWVSFILKNIFELPFQDCIVFKGGTSLSKGWGLISRFSEDIDLGLDRSAFGFEGHLGSSTRTKLRKAIREFVIEEFAPLLSVSLLNEVNDDMSINVLESTNSDEDPSVIEIKYPTVTEASSYLKPSIILEVIARSLFEPFELIKIDPLIGPSMEKLGIHKAHANARCVLPKRTLLEKIFLLHEEFQKKSSSLRAERLSRHMYDIVAISKTIHAEDAFSDTNLFNIIIEHRKHLTRISGVDYTNHLPGNISILPPNDVVNLWEEDYRRMQESMIYGESPSFALLLEDLKEVMNKVNAIVL